MTRKSRRLVIVLACGAGLASATALTLNAFSGNMVFFMAPADMVMKPPAEGQLVRLGGLVQMGSVKRSTVNGESVAQFSITDGHNAVPVSYVGILPDLFREGQGVVTLGALQPDHRFRAQEVLAKHDETYMPKDVAEALKKSGHWKPPVARMPMASASPAITPVTATQ